MGACVRACVCVGERERDARGAGCGWAACLAVLGRALRLLCSWLSCVACLPVCLCARAAFYGMNNYDTLGAITLLHDDSYEAYHTVGLHVDIGEACYVRSDEQQEEGGGGGEWW